MSTVMSGADSAPVRYIERTRAFYEALGYEHPYRWARFEDRPFTRPRRPTKNATVTLITTASLQKPATWQADTPLVRKEVYSMPAGAVPERLFTDDLSWHKEATHTDDLDSFFPVPRLEELVAEGEVGRLARRLHGVPTEFSQRLTREVDAPEVLRRCRQDEVDVALLVPL